MPTQTASIQRTIEVEGTELVADVEGQLESALVVDRLAMPDMFVLVFRDPDRDILQRAGLEVGKKVKVSATGLSGDTPALLIAGEVTSVEADYDSLGTRAVVRGYDKSHRLAAGRKSATYQNVKYSDIVSQIASAAGLTADVDDSGSTVDHVLQGNVSDLDFLYDIARRIGFELRVDEDTLKFKKPVESANAPGAGDFTSEDPVQLVWNHNLLEFRARMSAVSQVQDVTVRGWDPSAKEAVIGQADVEATNAELAMSAADLAGRVNGGSLTVVDHPVASQEAADELAKARAQQVGSAAFEATAVVVGSPSLKAGVAVNVSGTDPALEGKWVVTGSRHEFGNGTYRTALEFTGRQDRSIHGLVSQGAGAARERFFGVAFAIVTDNDDPEQMGRVKVTYPWLADDAESYWARVSAPGAGKDYGVVWIPQVGDEVLVAFEHGDVMFPVVLGGMWNGKDTIPFDYGSGLDAGSVTYCGFTSRTGHKISFLESGSESKIRLLTSGGAISIILDEQNKELKIETTGKVTIDAQQDIEITTQGKFKVDAVGVEITASGQAAFKGATVGLN
jgi:uncharacterized protein involved in type VI secretion and phage assembly